MMLYALNFLIIFVTLSCNEDYIALLCHHASCTNRFLAIYNANDFLHLLRIQTCKHIVDDVLWFLETWIVTGDDHFVALLYCLLCHERTLTLVSVTASSAYGDDFTSLAVLYLVDSIEHILQCVWSMCIVNVAV